MSEDKKCHSDNLARELQLTKTLFCFCDVFLSHNSQCVKAGFDVAPVLEKQTKKSRYCSFLGGYHSIKKKNMTQEITAAITVTSHCQHSHSEDKTEEQMA